MVFDTGGGIKGLVRREPTRLEAVRRTLERWRHTVSPASQPYVLQWERLVEEGLDACLAKAVEDSEHAAALRQSSPFASVLSHAERFQFLKRWRASYL
jgi:hypothetical protein